jgi:hypothetical protein
VGQANGLRRDQQFAACAALQFPDACPLTCKTARPPPDAAQFTDSGGNTVPAADRDATADRDAAADWPAHHGTADPDAHFDRDHVGNGHVGRDRIGRNHVGDAVAVAGGERGLPASHSPATA